MSSGNRLGRDFGAFIDRKKPIQFTFDGKTYEGFEGDVIASALAANDQWLLSRSFKYHRPRGVLSMAGHDANSIVQVGKEPNVYADLRAIEEGMDVVPVNVSGSLANDRLCIMGHAGRFLPVGFYYRSFFKPKGAWRFWEPVIRRIAGLGVVHEDTPHHYYDKAYGFYDVVVVGGGHAGLSAAIEAAKTAESVLIVDDGSKLGGALNYARLDVGGKKARELRDALVEKVQSLTNVTVMSSAVATGLFTDCWLSIVRGNRFHKIRGKGIVLATGAVEQPVVFRNNDRPGVMLVSAAQRLMRLYGVRPGTEGVIITANDEGYALALDCSDAGINVGAVLDMRALPSESDLRNRVQALGIRVEDGCGIAEVLGASHVSSVKLARLNSDTEWSQTNQEIACDFVAMAPGYAPNGALVWQGGGWFAYDDDTAMHLVTRLPKNVYAAGMVNGVFAPDVCELDGQRAGAAAAGQLHDTAIRVTDATAVGINHPYPITANKSGKDFVDFDEDLQTKDVVNGLADGYRDVQLLKRYSTLGMGPSQGRHSNVNAIRIIARQRNLEADEVGTTTTRPPYRSEKFGVLAGRAFEPERHTAMHHRHVELGAEMMPAGLWLRPAQYNSESTREDSIAAEVNNCRNNVGVIDVSTLGGIEVRGPDAAEFVNRMYTWAYKSQKTDRARYLLMTDEAGVVVDDGVSCRLHDNLYYLTATTGGVDNVFRQMLFWNAQWGLDVDVANVTAAYAGVNIAGPNSRKVLQKLTDLDLSKDAFPYMGAFTGTVAGTLARLLRVGFVGELGYEVHVPSNQGEALWDALMEAGADYDIRPFGVEAQRVMRLEKGHFIVGQDTDGLTTPHESGMEWAIGKKKPYYVGHRAVAIQAARGVDRQLVGFEITDAEVPCPKECHLVIRGDDILGRVTSAVRSPTLGKIIGLAYVAPDQARVGTNFTIKVDGGKLITAQVCHHPFYDPDNKRQEL